LPNASGRIRLPHSDSGAKPTRCLQTADRHGHFFIASENCVLPKITYNHKYTALTKPAFLTSASD
jgi:hypothetical protein